MNDQQASQPNVPTQIRLDQSKELLTVSFGSGDVFEYSAEY